MAGAHAGANVLGSEVDSAGACWWCMVGKGVYYLARVLLSIQIYMIQ